MLRCTIVSKITDYTCTRTKIQLKHKSIQNTDFKTVYNIFRRAPNRLLLEALQPSPDGSDHPQTLSKPKYGLVLSVVYVFVSVCVCVK